MLSGFGGQQTVGAGSVGRALDRRSRGFTIIELMTAITIVAVLIGLGVPSLASYLQATKLASAANNYYAGVQLARAEAIRRNLPVEFVLTNTPIAAGIESTAVANANGQNWLVRVPSADATVAVELVEAKSALEGAFQAAGGASPIQVEGVGVSPATFDGTISFNGFGGTSSGGAYVFDLSYPGGGACAATGGPMRCPRITVSGGGQVHLCDPAAATGDSRAC